MVLSNQIEEIEMSGYEIAIVISTIALIMSSGAFTAHLVTLLDQNYQGLKRLSVEVNTVIAAVVFAISLATLIICSVGMVIA